MIEIIQRIGKLFYKYNNNFLSNNILLIRLDEIGDVAMTSPLLRELRRNYPRAKITLIVKPQVYNLVELCPYVDEVLIYKKIRYKFGFMWNIIKSFIFSMQYLWQQRYDLAIVPRWDNDEYFGSFLAFFSGAKRRIAYSEHVNRLKQINSYRYDGFFTEVLMDNSLKHEVERNLDIVTYLGGTIEKEKLEVWTNKEDCAFVEKFLKNKYENGILISLFPSAGNKRREWDIENLCEVIRRLTKKWEIKFLLLGDAKNTELFRHGIITKYKENVIDCVGKTSLRETIAMLQTSDLYWGGDTGPMHLAVACGLSGVVMSCHPRNAAKNHENSPERFGPWQSKLKVLQPRQSLLGCEEGCQKNYAHCINQITIDEVYMALENAIVEKMKNGK